MEYRVFYSVAGEDYAQVFRSRFEASCFIVNARKTESTFMLSQVWVEKIVKTCIQITEDNLAERVDPETFFMR